MSNYVYVVKDADEYFEEVNLLAAFPDKQYAQDYIDFVKKEEGIDCWLSIFGPFIEEIPFVKDDVVEAYERTRK